jgi:4-aminobutyrate aminotransferase-like enzyme
VVAAVSATARAGHAHLPSRSRPTRATSRWPSGSTLAPGTTAKKTILFTTGAEAVENALKIARFHTRRSAIIAFSGAFHGRTLATMSADGQGAAVQGRLRSAAA